MTVSIILAKSLTSDLSILNERWRCDIIISAASQSAAAVAAAKSLQLVIQRDSQFDSESSRNITTLSSTVGRVGRLPGWLASHSCSFHSDLVVESIAENMKRLQQCKQSPNSYTKHTSTEAKCRLTEACFSKYMYMCSFHSILSVNCRRRDDVDRCCVRWDRGARQAARGESLGLGRSDGLCRPPPIAIELLPLDVRSILLCFVRRPVALWLRVGMIAWKVSSYPENGLQ